MQTNKSIYETPLVLVEAFSTELGFATSPNTGISDIDGDNVYDESDGWN